MSGLSDGSRVFVRSGVWIDRREFSLTFSRSGGPGGQNVNKVNTKVTLRFDVSASANLSQSQRERIVQRLRTRVSEEGVIQVVCSEHRSQAANRRAAEGQLCEMLAAGLAPVRRRKATSVPPRSRRRRLEEKKQVSEKKSLRKDPRRDD